MLQSKIVSAYKALTKLSQQDLPIRLAFDLFKIKQLLQPQWDFQIEEETKVTAAAKPLPDGRLEFQTTEEAETCRKKLTEIGEMEVELEIKKASIPLTAEIRLSVEDIEALKDFVEFE